MSWFNVCQKQNKKAKQIQQSLLFRKESNRMFSSRSPLNKTNLDPGPEFSEALLKAVEVMIRKQNPHLRYIFQYQSHYWNQMGKMWVCLILPGF